MSHMNFIPRMLHANGSASTPDKFTAFSGKLDLEASKDSSGPRKFKMSLYNGGPMEFYWSDVPVYVDLQGMDLVNERPSPVFKNHSENLIVGHTTSKAVIDNSLIIEGVISGAGYAAKEVQESADKGFPWQASQGTAILEVQNVAKGESRQVNGLTAEGPCTIVTKSKLGEASFVPLGADDTTIARMVAANTRINQPSQHRKDHTVKFEEWLKAKGFDIETLSDAAKTTLQASFDAENAGVPTPTTPVAPAPTEPLQAAAPVLDTAAQIAASRQLIAAEATRVDEITKLCAGQHADIQAKAIGEGWSKEKAELEVLRASRTSAPHIHASGNSAVSTKVMEVAILQASGASEEELTGYDERTIEAADKRYRSQISLQELLLEAAQANGYYGSSNVKANQGNIMRAAFGMQAAGFSVVDLSGIFSNIANKSLLAGWNSVDQSWRKISAIGSVTDFKQVTRYRMTGANQYQKVGPGGEIKSGSLGEESFTNQADTYALLLSMTRQDIINDDLGALTGTPRNLGRGAALKVNDVFWTVFMNNSAFFTSGNGNYISGATTALSIDGLTALEKAFLDQTDPDGKPLGIQPKVLLVPNALSALAAQLMSSLELRDTTASTKYGVSNPHAGKFETVVSPYLSNASYTGNSSTAFYGLADPRDYATVETVFLNGQQSPTIESADADFSTLGVQMRGYHDFGVSLQEKRAGVKSKGVA